MVVMPQLYFEAVSDDILWSMWIVSRQYSSKLLFQLLGNKAKEKKKRLNFKAQRLGNGISPVI